MKTAQLRKIIKEEIQSVLKEKTSYAKEDEFFEKCLFKWLDFMYEQGDSKLDLINSVTSKINNYFKTSNDIIDYSLRQQEEYYRHLKTDGIKVDGKWVKIVPPGNYGVIEKDSSGMHDYSVFSIKVTKSMEPFDLAIQMFKELDYHSRDGSITLNSDEYSGHANNVFPISEIKEAGVGIMPVDKFTSVPQGRVRKQVVEDFIEAMRKALKRHETSINSSLDNFEDLNQTEFDEIQKMVNKQGWKLIKTDDNYQSTIYSLIKLKPGQVKEFITSDNKLEILTNAARDINQMIFNNRGQYDATNYQLIVRDKENDVLKQLDKKTEVRKQLKGFNAQPDEAKQFYQLPEYNVAISFDKYGVMRGTIIQFLSFDGEYPKRGAA